MLNSVILLGRLVADPKTQELKEGVKLSTFTLAVEVNKDVAHFFDVKVFDNNAVALIHKGDKIAISGRLAQYKFTAKDNSTRSGVEIIASTIEFVDVKKPVEEK